MDIICVSGEEYEMLSVSAGISVIYIFCDPEAQFRM